jgi:hypothetical protein
MSRIEKREGAASTTSGMQQQRLWAKNMQGARRAWDLGPVSKGCGEGRIWKLPRGRGSAR